MGRKRTAGLRLKGGIWQIEKTINGQRVYRSTGTGDLAEAERVLAQTIVELTQAEARRSRKSFENAAAKYLRENLHKRSIDRDADTLKAIMPYLGHLTLSEVHAGTLQPYIASRLEAGISAGTLNRDLAIVRRILILAARMWRDEHNRPWLDTPPLLPVIHGSDRKPRPISQDEQARLFRALPDYLAEMALFAVHTGLRDQELCGLRWEYECQVPELGVAVFVIPESASKNGRERIVALNSVARSIIDHRRGQSSDWVFTLDGRRLQRMNNKAWRKARAETGLLDVRVHDLRHTFGMRLRAAGVGLEDRQDLLGHHAGRITTHYSKAEIANLIRCVELLCGAERKPELTLIRSA